MRKYIKQAFLLSVCFITVFPLFLLRTYAAQPDEEYRVLYIGSYTVAWDPTAQQIKGIKEALGNEVTLDFKFMDTKNVRSTESRQIFYQEMVQYLSEVEPYDVIIAGDDDAYNFAILNRNKVFQDIPIIFLGVNNLVEAKKAEGLERVAGIAERFSYYDTIELAMKINPNAKQVVAILDDTITGRSEKSEYYRYREKFPELEFNQINVSVLSREEFKERVSQLGEESILLFITCTMDKDRNSYTSMQSAKLLRENASIPVFTTLPIGLGDGILGGEIVSHEKMGYEAGQMAMRILKGEDPSNLKVIWTPPYTWCFDEKVVKQFGIDSSLLPKDAEIINHEASFFEKNIEMIRISAVAGFFLILLLLFQAVDNWKKRKANAGLYEVNETLEDTARHDALTKLLNRRVFMEDVQQKVKEEQVFGLIFFDIDNFKHINDTLGHNCGDEVLKTIAFRALADCDENMQVYRLAGDEFTAVVDSNDADVVKAYARVLQNIFANPFLLNGQEYPIHGSMGVAMYPRDGKTASDLIAAADAAMYSVKNNGKGGIAFSGEEEILR